MKRIAVMTKCVADNYASKRDERIVEVFDSTVEKGCLLSVRRTSGGGLRLHAYRCDKDVKATLDADTDAHVRAALRVVEGPNMPNGVAKNQLIALLSSVLQA